MKRALLPITLVTLVSVLIYSCSSDDDDSAASSVIQTPTPEPDATQYTLTVTAGEGGTVSTQGGTYDEGTSVSVTANPSDGYVLMDGLMVQQIILFQLKLIKILI